MPRSTVLHLLVSDLFLHHEFVRQELRLQILEKLLSRAYAEPWTHADRAASLFELFGVPVTDNLPIAPLTALYDQHNSREGIWLRADPVYLRADRDRVLLFDAASALTISQDEAQAIIAELNHYYADAPYQFIMATPSRWYVQLQQPPAVQFTPLFNVLGQDIHAAMPTGDDALQWRSVLNEVQMLLHQSSVNAEREARNELPINSIWLWGLGQLPTAPAARWQQVWTDNPLARGLACLTDVPYADLPAHAVECLAAMHTSGEYLVSIPPPAGDMVDWTAWLTELETQWFVPLFKALKARQLDTLICYPGDKSAFCITQARVRHWWRRRQAWRNYIHAHTDSTT